MNKIVGFWIASSLILFLLSLVYLQHHLHRKNALFAWWLCLGVSMQMVSAYGLVLGTPPWMYRIWGLADGLSYALAVGVIGVALTRRSCPVNQTLLFGLGAMVAFNLGVRWWGEHLSIGLRSWLLNIAFLGPAIFLLIAFSNIHADRLPSRIQSALGGLAPSTSCSRQAAFARESRLPLMKAV